MDQFYLAIESVNFASNFERQGNFNAGWRGENQWNTQEGAQWGNQGQITPANTQRPPLGFRNNFVKLEDMRLAWAEELMRRWKKSTWT